MMAPVVTPFLCRVEAMSDHSASDLEPASDTSYTAEVVGGNIDLRIGGVIDVLQFAFKVYYRLLQPWWLDLQTNVKSASMQTMVVVQHYKRPCDTSPACRASVRPTLIDGMGVRPHMSTSSTPASNVPEVKLDASTNQSLIRFIVNSLHSAAVIASVMLRRLHVHEASIGEQLLPCLPHILFHVFHSTSSHCAAVCSKHH